MRLYGSLKKKVQMVIFPLIISLSISLVGWIAYDYFMGKVSLLKNDVNYHLELLIKNPRIPLNDGFSHIINDISSFPFVNSKKLLAIKKDLKKLSAEEASTNRIPMIFSVKDEIENLEVETFHTINRIFMMFLLITNAIALAFALYLYFSFRRQLFSSIETISKELQNLDFSRVSKLKAKKNSPAEIENLLNGFNKMIGHVELYKLVFEAYAESFDLNEFAIKMYKGLRENFKINKFSIAEIIEDTMIVDVSLSDSRNIIIGEGFSQKVNSTCLKNIRDGKVFIVNDIENYLKKHPESMMTFIYNEGMKSAIMIPLHNENKEDEELGMLFFNSFEKNAFTEEKVNELKKIAEVLSYLYGKMLMIQRFTLSIVKAFTEIVEKKDEETGDHLNRMASYSREIAKELAKNPKYSKVLNSKFITQIYKQAPLHDIGKVNVPDNILQKPGKLDDDEFEIMKTHTIVGYNILDHIATQTHFNFFEVGKKIARSHHERWDGKGYPDGLRGNEIPICARIVAIADVFDALTSERPYKKAFDYDSSVRIILEESGTHFDPEVVNAFIRAQSKIRKLYEKFHKLSSKA